MESKGDKASNKAGNKAKPYKSGDGSGSDDEELPSVEELLRTPICNRTKLAAPDGNQTDTITEGLDVAAVPRSLLGPGTYIAVN